MLKTVFDRGTAALALLMLSPVFAVVAVLIRLESRGPVLFCHGRVGKDGKPFKMYKFRKMAETQAGGPKISPKLDPRLTRVGKVLERFKLDELPQLINIFRGEMSFVGPRPEIPEVVDLYSKEQRTVLDVKPGLVGPNQIAWRNEKDLIPEDAGDVEQYYIRHILPVKLTRDMQYVRETSFWQDMKFLATALAVTFLEPLKPAHLWRRRLDAAYLAADLSLGVAGFSAAVLLKYGLLEDAYRPDNLFQAGIIMVAWQAVVCTVFGVYKQIRSFFGRVEFAALARSMGISTALAILTLLLVHGAHFPYTLVLLSGLTTLGLISLLRAAIGPAYRTAPRSNGAPQQQVLIYGANENGEWLLERLAAEAGDRVRVVGFLDQDPDLRGKMIHGVQVFGNAHDLPDLAKSFSLNTVYVAGIDSPSKQVLEESCKTLGIRERYFPPVPI